MVRAAAAGEAPQRPAVGNLEGAVQEWIEALELAIRATVAGAGAGAGDPASLVPVPALELAIEPMALGIEALELGRIGSGPQYLLLALAIPCPPAQQSRWS